MDDDLNVRAIRDLEVNACTALLDQSARPVNDQLVAISSWPTILDHSDARPVGFVLLILL